MNRPKGRRRRALRVVGDSPVRGTGCLALALLFISVSAALLVAYHFHLGVAQTCVTVLVGGGTLPALYLAWATYRASETHADSLSTPNLADQLATAVGTQWEAEASLRRLNDPYPLPVHWVAADAPLADGWNVLVTLASTGAGRLRPAASDAWAAGPDGLAGTGSEIAEALTRVPTGRLVVLGEPGAGKTMLMVWLVLRLLSRRERGGVVPVLVSVAPWNPARQELREWLASEIALQYPAMGGPAPHGTGGGTRIASLLAEGLIVPILDGLDEIPDALRRLAIKRINEAMRPGEGLVLTCQTEPYRIATQPPTGAGTLRAAAVIQLCPLDADTVSDYLRDGTGNAIKQWEPVIAKLGTSAPLGQALVTPLMVGLARAIYSPGSGERTSPLRDPAELCDTSLTGRAAVERHLFDALVPAVYGCYHPRRRWSSRKARIWLVFLAQHLEYRIKTPNLAWWQLQHAVPTLFTGLVTGSCAGIVLGLATGIESGLTVGLATGLTSAIAVGLAVGKWQFVERPYRTEQRHHNIRRLTSVLAIGLATGASTGIAFGLGPGLSDGFEAGLSNGLGPCLGGLFGGLVLGLATARSEPSEPSRGLRLRFSLSSLGAGIGAALVAGLATGLPYGPQVGLISGLPIGLAVGLAVALKIVPPDLVASASPRAVLRRDRQAALTVFFTVGFGLGLGVGIGFPLSYGLSIGFAYGFVYGLVVGMWRTAWIPYELTRAWLALSRRLPWSLIGFLEDAHTRGVLRQAGTVYQFRHIELQHRLAKDFNSGG